jgi:type II secretory pathway pseudopilin PulG
MTRELRHAAAGVASQRRHGVALMAVVVTLVILAMMMAAVAWQIVATGRTLQHRHAELQADALARAGIEIAAARLLQQPLPDHEESLELIERSKVTWRVSARENAPDAYEVTCEARYPNDSVSVVVRQQSRVFQRSARDGVTRLESIPK